METPSKRGKIPQKDWPLIIKRYEAGETLAAIARTYDCSPPAISYILSRSRARDAVGEVAALDETEASQPGLAKTPPSEPSYPPRHGAGEAETASHREESQTSIPVEAPNLTAPEPEPPRASNGQGGAPDRWTDVAATQPNAPSLLHDEIRHPLDPPRQGDPVGINSGNRGALSQRGENRGTLRLALPQQDGHQSDPQPRDAHSSDGADIRPASSQQQKPYTASGRGHSDFSAATNYGGTNRTASEASKPAEGGAYIDRVLRQRVDEDIAAFLAAFDAALADDSPESRTGLRQATDRLLRAGARTRIELERLEARVPLPARENIGHLGSTWRPR